MSEDDNNNNGSSGLILNPRNNLSFRRPFTQTVKEILRVTNPSDSRVAFKVKTTSPKQYCVRPNAGVLEPRETKEIQVLLQPMKEDPPPDAKSKDKFLIQSIVLPEKESGQLAELWAGYEKDKKDLIQERKLRCLYLPAQDDTSANPYDDSVNNNQTPAETASVDTKNQEPLFINAQSQPSSSDRKPSATKVVPPTLPNTNSPARPAPYTNVSPKSTSSSYPSPSTSSNGTGVSVALTAVLVLISFVLGFQLGHTF